MALALPLLCMICALSLLLLPGCHGLHMLEEGQDLQNNSDVGHNAHTLVFGVHHKTGTELASHTACCFDSEFEHKEVQMFTCSQLPRNEKAVHFTRNPISLALSAYLYHKTTGEAWTWKRGSAMRLLKKDVYSRRHVRGTESYTQFLRRVAPRVGVRSEIFRLTTKGGEFDQIETGEKNCGNTNRCIEICLEDFTVSSKSYDSSWSRVVQFMGKHVTPKMYECLAKQDLHRHAADDGHVTSNVLPEKVYDQLRKMVWKVDNLSFNSRLKKLGQGRLHCGGVSDSLGRGVESLEYGGGYKEWLLEEEYSRSWSI